MFRSLRRLQLELRVDPGELELASGDADPRIAI